MEFMAAFSPFGARTAQTQTEVNLRLLYEHCKNELCGEDHMHVMLNEVHARSLEAIERGPQGMATGLPERCSMPRGSRIGPLPSAEPALESSACLGDHNCLRQCVQVH